MTYALLLLAAPLTPALYASGLGIEPGSAAYAAGRAHLIALIVGSGGLAASNVLEAVFRGLGQTRTALYVTACTVGLAAVMDPVLMLGLGPFPRLGIVVGRCTLTFPDPQLKGAWYPGGFNPCTYRIVPFK